MIFLVLFHLYFVLQPPPKPFQILQKFLIGTVIAGGAYQLFFAITADESSQDIQPRFLMLVTNYTRSRFPASQLNHLPAFIRSGQPLSLPCFFHLMQK